MLWLVCVIAIVMFPAWQVIPFDLIWISLALLYRLPALAEPAHAALTATAMATTAAAISDDTIRHLRVSASRSSRSRC